MRLMKFRNRCTGSLFQSLLLLVACVLASCSGEQDRETLHQVNAPAAYARVQEQLTLKAAAGDPTCPGLPPFTGTLNFRSRYEGSDRARDQINEQAEAAYLEATERFTALQQFLAKTTDKLVKGKGSRQDLACLLETLVQWARESDLDQATENHTGKAVRKWTLAAISANLLKINRIAEQEAPTALNEIKTWIGRLADQVVIDYSNRPLEKINNHDYWAAWSVMTSAALLDRPDLFAWSRAVYGTAMGQVTREGFLPNELRRQTRAAMYHNYALTPLAGIAVFLAANGIDPFVDNDNALGRLCGTVLKSVDDPDLLLGPSGSAQITYDLTAKGRLCWLAMYATLDATTAADLAPENGQMRQNLLSRAEPLASSRMGGDLGFLFLGQ